MINILAFLSVNICFNFYIYKTIVILNFQLNIVQM